MQQTKPFNELPDDEPIPGRMYNDGGHNIWIVKTTNPRARKKTNYREREIEVASTTLSELKELREKKNVLSNNEAVDDDYITEILANSPIIELTEETPDDTVFAQNTGQQTVKMTPRALFDILYESYANLKWKKKRNALIAAFLPYYKNYHSAVDFVDKNMIRRKHNKNSRYLRAYRKCTMNRFNYFVTFTYDDKKMNVDKFKQRLKDYLSNKVKRDGWKYLGVWEGWDGSVRLHFHALIFIPDGTLPGENFVETKYNPVTKQVETHTRNTEFNEKFGLSTIEDVIPQLAGAAYNYVLKYLDKGGKLMVSKNCPGYITGYINKGELVVPMMSNENKYVLPMKTEIISLEGEVLAIDEDEPQKCLPNATTCN